MNMKFIDKLLFRLSSLQMLIHQCLNLKNKYKCIDKRGRVRSIGL